MTGKEFIARLAEKVLARKYRSAFERGSQQYAIEILEVVKDDIEYSGKIPESIAELKKVALNGARDWSEASYGGCYLIYDCDIAERLCTPNAFERCKHGEKPPYSDESWLDRQALALRKGFWMIESAFKDVMYEESLSGGHSNDGL